MTKEELKLRAFEIIDNAKKELRDLSEDEAKEIDSIKEEIKTNTALEERVVAQIKRGEIHEAADVRKLGEIIKAKSKPAKKVLARYVEGKETLNAAYEELKDSGQINDILQKFNRFKEYISDTDLDEKIGSSQKELQDKLAYEIKGILKRLDKLQKVVK